MNDYTTFTTRLVSTLTNGLVSVFSDIQVERRIWNPSKLPNFSRYAIIVSPPGQPWEEVSTGAVRNFQYILRADLYLLVKNYDDTLSVWGDSAPNQGIFQLISDVKGIVRGTTLGGLLDKTYSEAVGPLTFEYAASSGFDSGEYAFIHRARLTVTARMKPFCVDPVS